MKQYFELKNVEEVRPGIFVQRREDGQHRVVQPLVFQGEWRIKQQFGIRNFITIAIVIFIAWSYYHDTTYSRELLENPCGVLVQIQEYCYNTNGGDTSGGDTVTIPIDIEGFPEE